MYSTSAVGPSTVAKVNRRLEMTFKRGGFVARAALKSSSISRGGRSYMASDSSTFNQFQFFLVRVKGWVEVDLNSDGS